MTGDFDDQREDGAKEQPQYLDADDYQQARHTWRMISELLSMMHHELEWRALPPAVIETILIEQHKMLFTGASEVEKMLEHMQNTFETLFPKRDEEDE